MEAVVSYAKTVLFFLLFVNLLMQLLKGSSYERFVQPVCGMILVIMMIRPLLGLFGGEEKVLYAAEQKISLLLTKEETRFGYEEEQGYEFAVLEAYEKELTAQLAEILAGEGLMVTFADFSISAEEKEFGTIRGITVRAEKQAEGAAGSVKIAPIVLGSEKREDTVSAEEIRIKDKLADFYQVDVSNINVTIKEDSDG